jgi:predicted nucleic acid-binding protein
VNNPITIVDAGPLHAYVDADDTHHSSCAEFLAQHEGALTIPQLVITEVAYLLSRRLDTRAELLFLADPSSGALSTEPVHPADWPRITAGRTIPKLPIGRGRRFRRCLR